ncbi:hypothetical protein INS49_009351 [Diaporthe citri]|uniref:uncharacterized protein n=1 Tax=Diaporthe citri TaxID=83186 RepID=UPI001C802190|nr:uncharacterized protein INS49_009351 [Diaporthe citri]KAG6361127.1 hypothetical protein INS49_009351 [Diaporthe citri]
MSSPGVVAHSASASNELGFEWTLMGRVDREPLEAVWGTMPFEAEMGLTAELTRSLKQPWKLLFLLFLQGISVEERPPPGKVWAEEEESLVKIWKDREVVPLRQEFTKILGPASIHLI